MRREIVEIIATVILGLATGAAIVLVLCLG